MSPKHPALQLAMILSWAACSTARAPAPAPEAGAITFSIETAIEPSSPLPPEARQVLSSHQDVRDYLANNPAETTAVLQAFEAAAVDLNGDGRADLVVRNPRLNGANIGPFWILVRAENEYRVAFFTRSLGLKILKTARRGWRDLRVHAATVDALWETVYRFDGRSYQPNECLKIDLGTRKQTRVPCQIAGKR